MLQGIIHRYRQDRAEFIFASLTGLFMFPPTELGDRLNMEMDDVDFLY